MEKVSSDYLDKYSENDYVWYACYGSNINMDRLMIYINGDKNSKLIGIRFSYADKTAEDCLTNVLKNLYR